MLPKSELRKQFCAITGTSDKTAQKYLEKYHYDLHQAADACLDSQAASEDPALVAIFDKYKESPELISIDGTMAFLQDLALEPEDLRSLTTAYLLGSLRMGEFERGKFMAFWRAALAGTPLVANMAKVVRARHTQILLDEAEFARLYAYCFDLVRLSDARIKSIPLAEATEYWRLFFGELPYVQDDSVQERLRQWYAFLDAEGKLVSKDLWVMWLRFVGDVIVQDPHTLSNYDEMSSWPSVIDEYVEWLREKALLSEGAA